MRSILCRLARLSRFAAVGAAAGAMVLPAFAAAQQATQTSLSAETRDLNGRTQATLSIAVVGEDGQPVSGPVVIQDGKKQLAGAALDAEGRAQIAVALLPGNHDLRAVFIGDGLHQASSSETSAVSAAASATPDFTITVNPASITLTPGQSGTVTASVTPINGSSLTAPMFVTLSCSGNPDQSSCAFTPENVEIQPNATAAVKSNMLITTMQGTGSLAKPSIQADANPVTWAVLLPGALGLAGLAFAGRRRRWLSRMSVIAFLGLVTTLGMTACAPRYNYYNHGPPHNRPTPSGSYTLKVTAQSSNGVAATTHSTTLAFTVK